MRGSVTTRRNLLKALAAVGGVAVLADLGAAAKRGRAGEAATAPRATAYHWRDPGAAGALAAQDALAERTYASAVYRAPGAFNAVGSRWPGRIGKLEVRASADGSAWTPWHVVTTHEHDTMGPGRDGRAFGDLLTGSGWRYVQYRLAVPAGLPPADVELVLVDSGDGSQVAGPLAPESLGLLGATQPPIVSRAGWGCDESYRFDSGGAEIWPREYRVVQKGIVHHTATSNDYPNAAAVVRAIYYYHAVTLKWGDIGYNYLVDRWGNVYEGRAGGANVVGGHALQYNYGSTGIACIGDFRWVTPTAETRNSLARVVAWTCRYLDPHGQAYFLDKVYPSLVGHRDVLPTTCPGDSLYAYLPALRDTVQAIIGPTVPTPAAQVSRVAFIPTSLPPGSALRVEVTVANTGSGTMITQGPGPGYTYPEGQSFQAAGYAEIPGAFRIAVDFDGNATGVDHPYRWGLPDALEPGQSTTVVGYVQLSALQRRSYWAGLVQEGVRWWASQTGTAAVKVLPAYCFPSAAPAATALESPPAAIAGLPNRIYLPLASRSVCE